MTGYVVEDAIMRRMSGRRDGERRARDGRSYGGPAGSASELEFLLPLCVNPPLVLRIIIFERR